MKKVPPSILYKEMRNNMENLVVTSIGYHDTGSSAVDDYLKEFRQCIDTPFEKECRIIQDPDGVADLEYALIDNWSRLNSGFALKRFRAFCERYNGSYSSIFGTNWMKMVDGYIESLISVKYRGYWHADIRVQKPFWASIYYGGRVLQNILKIPPAKWNLLPQEYSYHVDLNREEFIEKTIAFTDRLIHSASRDGEGFLLLEQLLPTTNISKSMRYFSNVKAVLVDRDPRDVFICHIINGENVLPKDPVEFCKVYRDSRKTASVELRENPERLLFVRFEDLIYKYDSETKRLKSFIGLGDEDHIKPGQIFKPEVSMKNTKQWEKHPQYSESCKEIARLLPEFLYPFEALD